MQTMIPGNGSLSLNADDKNHQQMEPVKNTRVVLKNTAHGSNLSARKIAFISSGDGIEIRQTRLKIFLGKELQNPINPIKP